MKTLLISPASRSAFSFALLLLVMPSCIQATKYQARPLSARASAEQFSGRTLRDLGLAEKSLDFRSLAMAAAQHHPSVEVALVEAEEAKAAMITAGARPNPTLGFIPTRVTPKEAGVSPWIAGFTLDIPIETAGKRGKRVDQARELLNAAALKVGESSWKASSTMRKAWLDMFAAEQRSTLLEAQLKTQQMTVQAFEDRLKAGESSRGELMQSRLLMNQSRTLASSAAKAAAEARVDVASALGLPAAALREASFDFSGEAKPIATVDERGLRTSAFTRRSDVLIALADYAAADALLRLEIAKQVPDLHLGPGYEFDQGPNKWSLGVSLTLPIFDHNQGPIAEAEAKRATAAAKFHALEAKISGELDRALASYRGALEKLHLAEEALAYATKQADAAAALRKAGEGDRLGVLSAQVEQDASLLARLDALVEVQQALAGLEDAAQTTVAP